MKANVQRGPLPKIKSYDDRMDLLAEWRLERNRLQLATRRLFVCIALAASITCAVFPLAQRLRGTALQSMAQDKSDLQLIAQRLTRAQRIAPPVSASDDRAMTDTLGLNFDKLTGHLYEILNTAQAGMALSHVSAEAQSGQIEIRCEGDAENFAVASQFAEQASGASSGSGNLSATRPNRAFGEHGVEFEYLRKVKLQ